MSSHSAVNKPVFLSHAFEDQGKVEAIYRLLEQYGIDCWMAQRDIPLGRDYDEAILDALDAAPALVLILSESSNQSVHVKHEVERATSWGKVVFPVRIQDVLPSKKLELHISTVQWLDAWEAPLESKMRKLAAAIRPLLGAAALDLAPKDVEAESAAPAGLSTVHVVPGPNPPHLAKGTKGPEGVATVPPAGQDQVTSVVAADRLVKTVESTPM